MLFETKDMPFDSSVGRAWDCNGKTRSQGHWFDPGSKEFLHDSQTCHSLPSLLTWPAWSSFYLFIESRIILMTDMHTATQDDRPLFTCISCSIAFLTAEEQRTISLLRITPHIELTVF
jgi:hypothetical protein